MNPSTEDVWTAFRRRLYTYIRARSRSSQDAEDILQDVFVKVHEHIGTLDDDAHLASWLYRVTHNTIIDHYRKKLPAPTDEAPPVAVEDDDVPIAEQRLAPFLRELIAELPSTYREALTLTELEGLTQAEMGQRLGLSTSGAKSRVQRGRAMVREQLLQCCHVQLDRRRHVIDYGPAGSVRWPDGCACASQSESPVTFMTAPPPPDSRK
jgi:RNA polymerase sigma-70 factor (ECF subfamily)